MKFINLLIIVRERIYAQNIQAQRNCSKQQAHEKILFSSYTIIKIKKIKTRKRKKRVDYCSSVGFVGVMGMASSVTSATIMASSITFSAVALEG